MPSERLRRQLADTISGARTERGYTQEDLAATIGCSTSTISRIESGERSVTPRMAERLAAFLGIPPQELIGSAVLSRAECPERIDGQLFQRMRVAPAEAGARGLALFAAMHCHTADVPKVMECLEQEARAAIDLVRTVAFDTMRMKGRRAALLALVRLADHALEGLSDDDILAARRCDTLAP